MMSGVLSEKVQGEKYMVMALRAFVEEEMK